MNKELVDIATSGLKRATDILFVQNPKGTSMGVCFGVVVNGFTKLFQQALIRSTAVDASAINIFYYVVGGIFVFNMRSLFQRQRFNEDVEQALALINEYKKNPDIPKWQIKTMYLQLAERVLQHVELDAGTKNAARVVADTTNKST